MKSGGSLRFPFKPIDMFALVDCNNFYASCERVFQPRLRKQPVVVLSNNDGCVIARSNEAKALGIPMGAPAFEYAPLFKKEGVHVFSSNYALYGDMSNRVMDLLRGFTPDIEVYSIDEAFLQFDGFQGYVDLDGYGKEIRRRVTQGTGIPISVGMAPTKTLAKVANRIAKKFPDQTGNVYVMEGEDKRVKALKWLPIGDVWGIGRQHASRLQKAGANTAFDFVQLPEGWISKNMGVVGVRLWKELQGIPCHGLEEAQDKKNIATTRSFDHHCSDYEALRERVVTFAVTCAEKLRKQRSCCNALMVFVHTNGHRQDLPQYSRNIVLPLPYPANSNMELAKFSVMALQKIFKEGYAYKKAGVVAMDFTPEHTGQVGLFENRDPRHHRLMETVDAIHQALGRTKVKLASQDLQRTWKMKQENLSPRYTTRINEVINVYC